MATGQLLHARLVLEGVEVPIISADVQSVVGSAAMASIQIPANDYALDLKPRTLVHLFVYDFYLGAPTDRVSVVNQGLLVRDSPGTDESELRILQPDRFESSLDETETDILNQKYKLLFAGEVVGISISKTPTNRNIVLQCVDFSSYWDIAFQYMVSGFSLGRGGMRAAFSNYNTQLFRDFFRGSADIITEILTQPPKSYPSLKGTLLGGLMHLIEGIGGTYYGDKGVYGTNDFFSLAEMRLHITQMVGANPFPSKSETRLLTARGFGGIFRRNLSGLGKEVSIRQVLLALEKYIFHQVVPITSPRYIPAQIDPNSESFELVPLKYERRGKGIIDQSKSLQKKADDLIVTIEANTKEFPAPKGPELARALRLIIKQAKNAENASRQFGKEDNRGLSEDFYGLPEATRAFAAAANKFERVLSEITTPSEGVRLPYAGTQAADTVIKLLTEIADDILPPVQRAQRRVRAKRKSFRQPNPPPRLLQQIYRPDVWMVAPPRCNVLFPELYTQFSYGRDYNSEITRLMLRTHDALFGSDILFDGFYFAPSRLLGARKQRKHRKKEPDVQATPAGITRDFMDHELYTGIIPAFHRMSDFNLRVLRGGKSKTIDGQRVGYAQLAVNHIFFQQRYQQRQLSVSAKFNPFYVLGFPSLVIDKYKYFDDDGYLASDLAKDPAMAEILRQYRDGEGVDLPFATDAQREAAAAREAGLIDTLLEGREDTHFLGTPQSLSHSIGAMSGGSTHVQMGYSRTTNEKTEFLGDNIVSTKSAKKTNVRKVRHRMACMSQPQVGTVGPRGGEIVQVRDITREYTRRAEHGDLEDYLHIDIVDVEVLFSPTQQLLGSDSSVTFSEDGRTMSAHTFEERKRRVGRASLSRQRSAITGQRTLRAAELPLFVPNRRKTGRSNDRSMRVPVGVAQPVAHYGPAVMALLGSAGSFQFTGEQANSLLVIHAYEIVEEIGVFRRAFAELPPEELTFPPWYGEHYTARQIGGLYGYFFGTGSIVDPLGVGKGQGGDTSFQTDYGASDTEYDPELDPVDGITPEGSSSIPANSDEFIGPNDPEFGEVRAGATVKEAVDSIVDIYSRVKRDGQDVNEFIRGYTWRPIATMVDILGTANLQIDDNGDVVQGVEGFHSRAFGDYDDLRTLVSRGGASGKRKVLGIPLDGNEKQDGISARLDTRKEKRDQVLKYLYALMASKGIL